MTPFESALFTVESPLARMAALTPSSELGVRTSVEKPAPEGESGGESVGCCTTGCAIVVATVCVRDAGVNERYDGMQKLLLRKNKSADSD